MSMIRCEHPCKYQKEGYCELNKAVSMTSTPFTFTDCVYFTPIMKDKEKHYNTPSDKDNTFKM